MDYEIYIPTRDRLDSQFTWNNLPEELRKITTLLCPEEEVVDHVLAGRNALARPEGMKLAAVRQWIIEKRVGKKVIMLDDDLSFFVRKSPDAHNLKPASPVETINIFNTLSDYLDKYVHGGLSPRQGNNWLFPSTVVEGTRMNAVHAINVDEFLKTGVKYSDVDMMEDYHVTLSLFEMGIPNFQLADSAWDQNRGSGAPGGFSHYRTNETQEKAALRLAELHPEFVTVTKKTPKTGSGGFSGERTDVRVSWKKALKSGMNRSPENENV